MTVMQIKIDKGNENVKKREREIIKCNDENKLDMLKKSLKNIKHPRKYNSKLVL